MEEILKKSKLKTDSEELMKDIAGEKSVEDYDVSEEIEVHTMPKRYLVQESSGKKAKGIGLLIFIGGFLLLATGFFGLYYVITNTNNKLIKSPQVEQIDNTAYTKTSKSDNGTTTSTTVIPDKSVIDNQQTSKTVATGTTATTTPDLATSTPNDIASSSNIKALDTDFDGLSDMEEIILGSNIKKADSDGDGYGDRDEVVNLYDPASEGRLADSKAIEQYKNLSYGYSLFYPAISDIKREGGEDTLIFKLDKNQFILVAAQIVDSSTKLDDWYKEQMDLKIIDPNLRVKHGDWDALRTKDGMTVYLKYPDMNYILAISYSMMDNTLYYKNIFDFMVKSVALLNDKEMKK